MIFAEHVSRVTYHHVTSQASAPSTAALRQRDVEQQRASQRFAKAKQMDVADVVKKQRARGKAINPEALSEKDLILEIILFVSTCVTFCMSIC